MAVLIDTSIFVSMERAGRPVQEVAVKWPDERFAVAAITASELLYGVERANTQQRRLRRAAFAESIFQALPVVAFDLDIARVHATVGASIAAIGRPIGHADLQIAATAIALGYDVLTENAREFGAVPGLRVLRPDW